MDQESHRIIWFLILKSQLSSVRNMPFIWTGYLLTYPTVLLLGLIYSFCTLEHFLVSLLQDTVFSVFKVQSCFLAAVHN